MQAKRILENAARGGKTGMMALCKATAARVPRYRKDIIYLVMMRGSHDAIDYLIYNKRGKETELVKCAVPGHEAEATALGVKP